MPEYYMLVYGQPPGHKNQWGNYVVLAAGTLEKLTQYRKQSGDLIVDSQLNVVQDPSWLFDWEKNDPNCYAQRAIRNGWSH